MRAEINFMHLLANAYSQELSKQTFLHLLPAIRRQELQL